MNDTTSLPASETGDDLSALAWVQDELRRSLEAAHKSLKRFAREAEAGGGSDVDAVDPAVLRAARSQIHQGVGALELVGLPAAATLLRASEALVQRVVAKPQRLTPAVIEAIERASFGLLDYLGRLLAGKTVSPLALFPQYRAVQEAAGAERVHPADLWSVDWQWRELPSDPSATPRGADAATRGELEAQLLTLMKTADPAGPAARMSDICADLGSGAADPHIATFWKLAAAVFEAQAQGLLGFDVFSKRVASRLLAQFRGLERGEEVSERLAQDLLFFCAQSDSPGDGARAPRNAAVRRAYGLVHYLPANYEASPLGRFDPALLAQARKRVGAAKEAWSAVAGGEMHRLAGLSEQFALVGESLKRLFPHGEVFAAELQQAVAQTQQSGSAPPAPLAMEVATSLLYVEAVLEDADFDHPEQAGRVRRLAERLANVRQGRPAVALESWMEELYRRVSDRQTMGSVVQELRASLSDAEKSIDLFFRNPAEHAVLAPVPNQLNAMRGVLSVLGMDHASAALLRMRDEVDGLISTEIDPERVAQAGVFDRLAGNLGALGFLIDMLSVQPQMAKSLFRYDAATGTLSPVMGRAPAPVVRTDAPAPVDPRLIERAQSLAFSSVREDVPVAQVARDLERLSHEALAADHAALAATVRRAREALEHADDATGVATARGELSEALVDFVASVHDPVGLDLPAPAPLPPIQTGPAESVDSGLGDDAEMREVFLEEAREVLADAATARAELDHAPDDLALLTTLRRAFHTLKGSARMVGLKDFGDAAWTAEQLYNSHLGEQKPATPALLAFTGRALAELGGWVESIARGEPNAHAASTLTDAADRVAHATQGAPAVPPLPMFGLPPDLPSAADLDLASQPSSAAAPLPPIERAAPDELSFEFDLASLETPFDAQAHGLAEPLLEPLALDLDAAALLEPFDSAAPPTEPGSAALALREPVSTTAPDAVPDLGLPETIELDGPAAFEVSAGAPPAKGAVPAGPFGEPVGQAESEAMRDGSRALHDAESEGSATAVARSPRPEGRDEAPVDAAHAAAPEAASLQPEPAHAAEPAIAADAAGDDDEQLKAVGPLRISIPLFNIYLNEADELSRRLSIEVAEWAMELHRPIGEIPVALAHSLAGSSATVGFADLSQLARLLEHAESRSQAIGHGTEEEGRLFVDAAEEIRRLLHQFAAGFLKEPAPDLMARLADHERSSALRLEAATAAADRPSTSDSADLTEFAEAAEPVEVDAIAAPVDPAPDELDEPAGSLLLAAMEEPADGARPQGAPAAEEAMAFGQAGTPTFGHAEMTGGVGAAAPPDANMALPDVVEDASLSLDFLDLRPLDPDALGAALAPESESEPAGASGPPIEAAAPTPTEDAPAERMPAPASEVDSVAAPELEPSTSSAAPIFDPTTAADAASADAFAADTGFATPPPRFGLTELKPFAERPAEPARPVAAIAHDHELIDADAGIDAVDALDAELFPIFEEEAEELLPQLSTRLRDWLQRPADAALPAAAMRTLHTLKGGARLAGAMRLGEMAHRLETRIERLLAEPPVPASDVEALQGHGDALTHTFEALRRGDLQAQSDAEQAFVRGERPMASAAPEPGVAQPTGAARASFAGASGAADAGVEPSVLDAAAIHVATPMPVVDFAAATASTPGAASSATTASAQDANAEPAAGWASAATGDDAPAAASTPGAAAVGTVPAEPAAAPAESTVPAGMSDHSTAEPSGPEGFAGATTAARPAVETAADASIDWSRFAADTAAAPRRTPERAQGTQSSVRVRAPLLDRLVNQAGEVSITRSRIESGVAQIKGSLADLTENLERLRAQLRDIEFHGETQMSSRMEAAKAASQSFDPLEFDRFTRFQELTRMMAESVNDVATVQRSVQRAVETTEDELVAQARLTRDLQADLLRTRMVEFEGLSDRLYRVVRQAAKETGKSVRLDIVGGGVEVDRGVLDRMTASFEHLLRNSVVHGIEAPSTRIAAGKDGTGTVIVALTHEGNEVGVEFRDDGAGLDLARIRAKGVALGILAHDARPSDAELANLIFMPGFSTADGITELAGRGVGMDVVRSEVDAMGGRVETATSAGQGTSFKLVLPLTTAVTQVVMLRCGETRVAVPSTLIEAVRRATPAEVDAGYARGEFEVDGRTLPFHWLGALLQISARPAESQARTRMIVAIRSAQQRIALHVDEVIGNQEVVVKHLGPQLSRMPGLAGVTLLASGAIALIYNPVALATLYGDASKTGAAAIGRATPVAPAAPEPVEAPLVMVVDDSLTVRRVTQRLLTREGYRVVLAKDGLDALERLAEEVPQIVLSDIEMPRMDGFDLVRNMRADARLRELPVIMITSRIAQKHRDYAAELGVDHYLGKPYSEDDLLGLVARYTARRDVSSPGALTTA